MVYYESIIKKKIKKGLLPKHIVKRIHNAFLSIDMTDDLGLFDIKRIKCSMDRKYYRLRKGKYRAIFYIQNNNIYVIDIGKREEVYDLWE